MSTEETATSMDVMPSMQLLAEAAQEQEKLPEPKSEEEAEEEEEGEEEIDDRSSSLSELEDRIGTEGDELVDESSDMDDGDKIEDGDEAEEHEEDEAEDTEAETERLHESPHKSRVIRSVTLRDEDHLNLQVPDDNIDQTSEISALSESVVGDMSHLDSPVSSPRKRKRNGSEDEDNTERSLKKVSRKLAEQTEDDDDEVDAEDADLEAARDDVDYADEGKDEEEDASGDEHPSSKEVTPEREKSPPMDAVGEGDGSGGEEIDAEPEADDANEAEIGTKGEEDVATKEAALGQLRTIEKDFAVLRDKMFAERTKQLNEELNILQSNPMAHPEYAAALEALDRRRADQIALAKVTIRYKMSSLRQKSVAERTMAHSQYMQDVRNIRETSLEECGNEWYRLQKDRRRGEEDGMEKRYHFVADRSKQVAHQQAYNQEVSILAGVQKYVGFPAAPDIEGATTAEIEEDLKKMGIPTKPIHNVPISAPISSFPRQRLSADEHFYERNPWANPYAPQILGTAPQPQVTPAGPFTTPAGIRQPPDVPQGSASTIAVSSVEQTPMSSQVQHGAVQPVPSQQLDSPNHTPSRPQAATTGNRINSSQNPNGPNGLNGLSAISRPENGYSPNSSPLKAPAGTAVPVPAGN